MEINQENFGLLGGKAGGLKSGQGWRVLGWAVARCGQRNQVPEPREYALERGVSRPTAYRGYGELVEAGLLVKHDRRWFLTPVCFRVGSKVEWESVWKEIMGGRTMKGVWE